MPKRLTLEEVQAFIDEYDVNEDCILLATEYKNVYQPLEFYCNSCGKIFTRDLCHLKQRKVFCCQECAKKRAGERISIKIEDIIKYLRENDIEHQCTLLSITCKNSTTPLKFMCNVCGKSFERDWQHIKRGRFRCPTCGQHAGAIHKKYTREDVIADIAKKGYKMIGEYINAAIPFEAECKRGHKIKLIYMYYRRGQSGCQECQRLDFRGPNHPNWKGGESEVKDSLRKSIKQWKREVLIRDGFACALTGIKNGNLVIHHLISFNTLMQQASENTGIPILHKHSDYEDYNDFLKLQQELIKLHKVENGITLSRPVHDLFHELYGRGNNTKEQFEEFQKNFLPESLKFRG